MPYSLNKHKKEKKRADRGVSYKQSKKIFVQSGICIPVGSGKYI